MIVTKKYTFREKFSWSLYDWPNSVFATTVLAGFPLLNPIGQGCDDATSTALLRLPSSVAELIIVLIAPILGALADLSQKKDFPQFLLCWELFQQAFFSLFLMDFGNGV